MPIAINGSGTVTGVSVGGLPDGIVDTDMLAAARIGINNRFLINKIPQGPFTKHFTNHLELYGYLLHTFAI